MMWRDYECASMGSGDLEFGASIPFSFSPAVAPADRKFSTTEPRLIEGFATRYNKVHRFKGGYDVFRPGVFARSLLKNTNIRLLQDHDESKLLATTADSSLELKSDGKGLSFLARVAGSTEAQQRAIQLLESNGRACMSVCYMTHSSEMEKIDGLDIRFINDASLTEVSIVTEGAVKQAFAVLLKSGEKSTFSEGGSMGTLDAHSNLMSAIRALQVAVGSAK